jgi:hypothetical protein
MLELYIFAFVVIIYIAFSFSNVKYGGTPNIKIKNILIVDVANMYVSWKKETGRKQSYWVCMSQHYKEFIKHNDVETCKVLYVIKNYNRTEVNEKDEKKERKIIRIESDAGDRFRMRHPHAILARANDYSDRSYEEWERNHYMKGRDDYLCFYLARIFKRGNINTVIMSNDKFKDFVELGFVPPFSAVVIYKDGFVEHIYPRMNALGQLSDYQMTNITLDFSFDKKYRKDPSFKQKPIWL